MTNKTFDILFITTFLCFTALQFAALFTTTLGLSPDEAYYWQWSQQLDYGYYSKGPVVAYLIAVSTALFGDSAAMVRLPALFCYSLFSLLFYLFARKIFSAQTAFFSWLMLRCTLIFAQLGFLMTTDAPLLLLWLIALICGYQAIIAERERAWIGVGFATGCGILTKYTAGALFGSLVMFLLLCKSRRAALLGRYFIAAIVILCLFCTPLLLWDARHGWVNFSHNASHVASGGGFALGGLSFKPYRFFELLGGQLAVVGPIVFVLILYCLKRGMLRFKAGDLTSGFFFFSSVPLGILCVLISFTRAVYANWPLPVYVGGFLLCVHLYQHGDAAKSILRKYYFPALFVQITFTLLAHLFVFGFTLGLPVSVLTTKKLIGWPELAARVDLELSQLTTQNHSLGENPSVVITDSYGVASELAFYGKSHPKVYCAKLRNRRMNQYDIWNGWEKMRGKNALIVMPREEVDPELRQKFERVEAIPEPHEVRYAGNIIKRYFMFRAYRYDGSSQGIPIGR